MANIQRVFLIVLDSCGVGELPGADKYGDSGSNTLVNTAKAVGGLKLPNLEKLGLGNIDKISGVEPQSNPKACFGKMAEKSFGKDSTNGHWEMMGVIVNKPFPTYPDGFPKKIISEFENKIGRKTLGNFAASGTEIIKQLGEEHLKTGYPIVYTSADSVFQIAAHEEVISLPELYEICLTARRILAGEHGVGRVIARPFIGKQGNFNRTSNRKDFSLPPPEETVLDKLKKAGYSVVGIGKLEDLFAGHGFTSSLPAKNNQDTIHKIKDSFKLLERGLLFANLVDFDMLWGHRNDPSGFASGLEEFDCELKNILELLEERDLLIITADHGCDPTTPSTDHSREYVPLLVYGKSILNNINLKIRESFADIGATISEIFGIKGTGKGKSFWKLIGKENKWFDKLTIK